MRHVSFFSTEGLARASSRRPWRTIGIWVLALLAAGTLVASLLQGALTTSQNFVNDPESKRADRLIEERLRGPARSREIVIVRSDTLTVDDPAFRERVQSLRDDISGLGAGIVEAGPTYYQLPDQSLVSSDRRETIFALFMAGSIDDASKNIGQVHEVVDRAGGQGFQVLITGNASVGKDFQEVAEKDLRNAEVFGVPVALVILVFVFGAIAAAVLPVILAAVSIAAAMGATALLGQVFSLSFFVTNMITMMGLAVGIDYSLFVVSRYREERARGLEKLEAIARAGATASRAVLFSGVTVVLALLGMLLVPTTVFRSLAAGAILVVIAAVLASLTLLPALLAILGDRVNAWRLPFVQRAQAKYDEQGRGGLWDRAARLVMRYPVFSLVATVGLLVATAIPFFSLNTGFSGVSTLPDSFQSKQGFLVLARDFSAGVVAPAEIVIDGRADSAPVQSGIQKLRDALAQDPSFGPARLEVNPAGDLAVLSTPVAGEATSEEAISAIKRLREQYIPQAFSGVPAAVLVTGATAQNMDFFDLTADYTPIVFSFVLGLSFILLMLVFRSIVVPVKAILMNLLSVGAAYGLLVLVFQKGWGTGVLGFQHVPTIEAWIPLFLFSVLFGLSMDYHVFLLSRIREHYDQSGDNTESVAFGLRSTGRLITGAAFIMVAVFAGFASGEMVMFQQMGFGLAVAVLMDATIIRSVLVPASMRLLGKANWYFPKALRWLPDLRVEASAPSPMPVAGGSDEAAREGP